MSPASLGKVTKPPSSFAQLLRQSKFSSFDLRIGQIYTSHEGSSVRGDFGLKRPITRRKGTRIRVSELDSSYQQTIWKRASSDANWMRKMDRLDVVPTLTQSSKQRAPNPSWHARFGVIRPDWLHDSDYITPGVTAATFGRPVGEGTSDSTSEAVVNDLTTQSTSAKGTRVAQDVVALKLQAMAPAPNPFAMDNKQFERYLKRIRNLDDEFKPFLAAARGTNVGWRTTGPEPHYKQVKEEFSRSHTLFLAQCFADDCFAPKSTKLRPLPHPTAGLAYSQTTELQDGLLGRPVPGRRVVHLPPRQNNPIGYTNIVAVAGFVGREHQTHTNTPPLTDPLKLSKDPDYKRDIALFRPARCVLYQPPRIVSKGPWSLDDLDMHLQVINWDAINVKKLNPHRPGTREYVGCYESVTVLRQTRASSPNIMQSVKRSRVQEETVTVDLIGKLRNAIERTPIDETSD